jgi:TRAP transporter 4TM/12TM fusion protein
MRNNMVEAKQIDKLTQASILKWALAQKTFSNQVCLALIISIISISFGMYHMFTVAYGSPESHIHRLLHLNFALILTFILWPIGRKSWKFELKWYLLIDLAIILFIIYSSYYTLHDIEAFNLRIGAPEQTDVWMGFIYMLVLLEATRRVVGWPLVLCAVFFIIHSLFAPYFPGIFYGPPSTFSATFSYQFMADEGIFGIPIMASSSFIILFMIFGAALFISGAGPFFTDMAFALTGAHTGGPAKSAIVSSALFGTVSGSPVANVATTGTFTIPLMKHLGYRPAFAGAVEAVASTGGAIMPPVMAATAFIMALFLGISYLSVCLAAAIPAILYYGSLFAAVHFEAKRCNLKPMDKRELPDVRKVFRQGGFQITTTFALLVGLMVIGYTPMTAAFWAIIGCIATNYLSKRSRMGPVTLLTIIESGSQGVVMVAVACACAGIVIGAVTDSGFGIRVSNVVVTIGQNQLWLALISTMFASLILGMGITTTAVYVTLVVLVIPALEKLGIPPIAAHMFAFYFGVLSAITPPVALAAYAAAGIAGAKTMETGWVAVRLAISGFIVPFMFAYSPELLLIGSWYMILFSAITALIGVTILSSAVVGYLFRKTYLFERVILFVSALCLIKPGIISDLTGFVGLGFVLFTQIKFRARSTIETTS